MSTLRSFLFAIGLIAGQLFSQDGTQARVGSSLRALGNAPNDQVQDSINALIKQDLRTLLAADGALTADFKDLPMTRVDAPDGIFRLFTWNLPRNDGHHLFEGFLLVKTSKGQVLFELRDMTANIPAAEVPELGPDRWYGALYYDVIPVTKGSRTYYTLLGWKGYSKAETRKVIEVLSFKNGKPRFGAPLFGKGKLKAMRKVYGYAFQATMTLRYDPTIEGIVMDHLSPSRADMAGQPAYYGPDMTHDAYFWHKGEWWFGPDIDLRDPGKVAKPFKAPPKP
ncbi:MAG: hypothetical protein JNL43_01690 [Flavobacteriales bacterium]|nr:hypothetical protein [Flavobacteriales bacterium]